MSVEAPVRPSRRSTGPLATAAAAAVLPDARPSPDHGDAPEGDITTVRLAPVPSGARRHARNLRAVQRPDRRRSPAVPALVGVGMVIAALLALAVMHALLIGGQLRLDGMHRDVASEQEEIRRLSLRVAELESPDRVLDAARERLGMVQPEQVGYLLPGQVDTGQTGPVRVEAAQPEPEPEPEPAERSPEQVAVDVEEPASETTENGGSDGATDEGTVTEDDAVDGVATADAQEPSEGGRDE